MRGPIKSIPAGMISISSSAMERLKADEGDMIYLADNRWYLGGLRSEHVKTTTPHQRDDNAVLLSSETSNEAYLLKGKTVYLEKIF
jgi:hypothetical protein